MPIEPVDPSKKTGGDGTEKYSPNEKRGPGKFDEALERAKTERAKADISKMAEDQKAKVEAERPRTYTERLQDMGRLPKPTGSAGGDFTGMKGLDKPFKAGGKVKRYNDGGMSLEEKYPNAKITRLDPAPPPVEGGKGSEQHIRNLEALRYKRDNANAKPELFEEPKSKSKSGGGGAMPKSNRDITKNYKAGGRVSSASKRADGCAIKGKTKGKMV